MGLKRRSGGPWWASLPFGALLAAAALGLPSGPVHAQAALSNCSQSVGASAAAVPFPASGATGPTQPNVYLEICNAHASQTLGVNAIAGGTAAIGSAGTVTLNPGGCLWWNQAPVPSALSVIGSGGATTTACWYK